MIRGAAVMLTALAGLAACAKPAYLGAPVPEPCRAKDIDACLGWMVERDLGAAELGGYDDPQLRAYVQSVVDRLAKVSSLDASPRVLLADRDGTYATVGGRIVVARPTLEKLGSEAELAGILAHEMAHIEGKHTVASLYGPHPDADWLVMRRDAEAIADERAILLLERAGYAPTAMATALANVLTIEDEEHPAKQERIARATKLAGGRGGYLGTEELYAHLAGMVVGRDPRAGVQIHGAWVVAAIGVAFELDANDLVRAADDLLVVRRGRTTLTGYVVGAPWAHELAAALAGRETRATTLGRVTAGTVAHDTARDDSPLGKLQHAVRGSLPQPPEGARVAILERPEGALVLELGGHRPKALGLRVATTDEIEKSAPARITIERAERAGTVADVHACRTLLDDPARVVRAGEPIKCASRTPLDREPDPEPAEASETPRDE